MLSTAGIHADGQAGMCRGVQGILSRLEKRKSTLESANYLFVFALTLARAYMGGVGCIYVKQLTVLLLLCHFFFRQVDESLPRAQALDRTLIIVG